MQQKYFNNNQLKGPKRASIIFVMVFVFVTTLVLSQAQTARALSVAELQTQIDQKKQEQTVLLIEKQKLEAQIQATGAQAKTLQTAVKTLNVTGKKLQNDLKTTQNHLSTTELSIQKTTIEIDQKETQIQKNKHAIEETLRTLNRAGQSSLVEDILRYNNLSELWDSVETVRQFQIAVKQKTDDLAVLRNDLKTKNAENQDQKKNLLGLKVELTDRKIIVDQSKQAKATLLSQTKDKEVQYQALLQANIAKGKQFEQDLFNFESQLQAQIDPSKLPSAHPGILSWPLNSIVITQRFGKTVDARRLYVSGTHNGVDFRATVGTPVMAVADGVVTGESNTDDEAGCYSYGRWLLVAHTNGLSSLYAHLSAYAVGVGQKVSSGTVVGYSGGQPGMSGSGYSLGPHLHLGLFATQGVKVEKYTASNFCKHVSIPVAQGLNAYLDPLAYLPSLN